MDDEQLVSLRRAELLTGITRRTITTKVDAGELESFVVPANSRLRLVRLADVQRLKIPVLRPREHTGAGAVA